MHKAGAVLCVEDLSAKQLNMIEINWISTTSIKQVVSAILLLQVKRNSL